MTFLTDNGAIYSYSDLLNAINQSKEYIPMMRTKNLFEYFVNVVKALYASRPLILLDSDINASEIDGVREDDINKTEFIGEFQVTSFAEVVKAIQESQSEITIFTSGTTGQPKKVVHRVSTLTRAVRLGEKYHGQVWGFAYNPTHMAGLQVFFQAFENENTFVNVFNRSRAEVYELIEKYQITHISATPTFYRLLLPYEKPYESVIRVTLGGEKSDQHLYDSINKIFPNARINNVYASTEAGSLFAAKGDAFLIPENIRDKFLIDENSELLIHKSLLGSSDSFKFDGDYYHSGDLIEWVNQEEGLFKFKSRKNELINVGGYKVNPGEVEEVINSIPGVRQSLVFGKPNSILGNVLVAEVQLEDNVELTELEIRQAIKDQLQDFKIPRKIKFVEEFSLTRTGKLKRS
jgi:acyl-coenzyme A synthetase/AMP-(fatty) acid ligase